MFSELIEIFESQVEEFKNENEHNLGVITANTVKYATNAMLGFESFSRFDHQQRIQLSFLLVGTIRGLQYGSVQERGRLVDVILEAINLSCVHVGASGFETIKTIFEANLVKGISE